MRCSKAQTYLSQELDEQLPADVIGDLDRHLDACAACRAYREDLALGQRLLAAAEPELPENFEWKLQLRLNRALRESAGEHLFPWQEEEKAARWDFLRGFGTAVPVGLAAVLALAMVVGPQSGGGLPGGTAPLTAPVSSSPRVAEATWSGSDRLPLEGGNLFGGRPVSLGGRQGGSMLNPGLSGDAASASGAILFLQNEVRRMRTENFQLRREIQAMQTRLDTIPGAALDLQESR